jgi:hypothetical protein
MTQQAPDQHQFWGWFKANEELLFHFERDRDRIFGLLSEALAKLSPHLTFEFGPIENGARDFVVSAGGIVEAFPVVEALVDSAPSMTRWKFIKFRQRRQPMMALTFADRTVDTNKVKFALLSNKENIGICLFFDEFTEEDEELWQQIGFILLDETLGEFDVETKIGALFFCHSSEHPEYDRFPLQMLPEIFDNYFAALVTRH